MGFIVHIVVVPFICYTIAPSSFIAFMLPYVNQMLHIRDVRIHSNIQLVVYSNIRLVVYSNIQLVVYSNSNFRLVVYSNMVNTYE